MVRTDGPLSVACSACNQPAKTATPRGGPVAKEQAGSVAQDFASKMCSGDYQAQLAILDGLRGNSSGLSQDDAVSVLSLAFQNCRTVTDFGSIFGSLAQESHTLPAAEAKAKLQSLVNQWSRVGWAACVSLHSSDCSYAEVLTPN
ncbi:hypothetical protein N2152v2_006232 [Parachlorella kessleri]